MDKDIYNGKSPLEMPMYTATDVSSFVRIPVSTIRSWAFGQVYRTGRGKQSFKPVLDLPDPNVNLLSFTNLVEVHVLSVLRRTRQIPLPDLRRSIECMKEHFNHPHPLALAEFKIGGRDIFIEKAGKYISTTKGGQAGLPGIIDRILERVVHENSRLASQLYLFTRPNSLSPESGQPKSVVVNPEICFGRPVITGTRITTDILAERFRAGEDPGDLAKDYNCEVYLINEAIRYETLRYTPMAA